MFFLGRGPSRSISSGVVPVFLFLVLFPGLGRAWLVPPEVGPWEYDLCQPSTYVSRIARECKVWDEGRWVSFIAHPACADMQDPRPWSEESKLVPKAITYYNGLSAATSGWLQRGESFGYNGCYSGPPRFRYGVEYSNGQEIHVSKPTGDTRLAVATRWREVRCPEDARATRKGCVVDGPPPKDLGCEDAGSSAAQVGDPTHAGTGNEYQFDTDYQDPSGTLSFTRAYNSLDTRNHGLGHGWTANFDRRLEIGGSSITVYRADGSGEPFTLTSGLWQGDADTRLELTRDGPGYTLRDQDGAAEYYDLDGRLLSETDRRGRTTSYSYDDNGHITSVTGPFGHRLRFGYDGSGRLSSLTDPNGNVTQYSYDANDNLVRVTYPDGRGKRYRYDDSAHPHALTSVAYVDVTGNVRPYAHFSYDGNGRVVTNTLADGQEHVELSYDSSTRTTVTDANGRTDVLTFTRQLDRTLLLSRVTQSDGKGLTQQFDARNNRISRTDAEGRTTTWDWDDQNRLISRTEAAGTPQERTTRYRYDTDGLDLPVRIDRPSVCAGSTRTTRIRRDVHHNPIKIRETGYTPDCRAISRQTSIDYNTHGQVIRIDGPRTDVSDITRLSYHDCTSGGACGQLESVTDALGHTTTFDQYDDAGHLVQKTDPNGLVTRYGYDARGRVERIIERPPSGASRTTTFGYTAAGDLARVERPDGRQLHYEYNDARERIAVTDNLGNRIEYGYDRRGNRNRTATIDPGGTLVRETTRVHDLRNHLRRINDGGAITRQVRDAMGQLIEQTDPDDDPPTRHEYDPLGRLIETVDALGGRTESDYDPAGEVAEVIAPNGADTTYRHDDFGNRLREDSPDRGTTTYQYDAAGNLVSKTDARGVTASYRYDALNRLTAIHYSDLPTNGGGRDHGRAGRGGIPSADVRLTYDSGPDCDNGIGRLCRAEDQSGVTTYAYDPFGNIARESHRSVRSSPANGNPRGKGRSADSLILRYRHDPADRLAAIVYPDGREVDYQRDVIGRIQAITTRANGRRQTLISDRQYRADGRLTDQTFGNGLTGRREYTAQGRLSRWTLGGQRMSASYGYHYDANGNLTDRDGPDGHAAYQYDSLDRLTEEDWGAGNYHNAYDYDGNGNRLSSLTGRGDIIDYAYEPQSNRLNRRGQQTNSLDAAGNTIEDGEYQYRYDAAGRLIRVQRNGRWIASYRYDYRGLRRQKITRQGITHFAYGPDGHLLNVRSDRLQRNRDYIWSDARPVARIETHGPRHRGARIHYLHSDAMGTPRLATNARQQIVWRWQWDAFGHRAVTTGRGTHNRIEINLRYPGQYFDRETGLHYNWHRYYDPSLGRYGRSDPIGLRGGLNSYQYAVSNPLKLFDPMGLEPCTTTCSPKDPDFSKPCFKQCRDPGACADCCRSKARKYCSWPFSQKCRDWVSWGRQACRSACIGGGGAASSAPGSRPGYDVP